jgi:hypothetical protein
MIVSLRLANALILLIDDNDMLISLSNKLIASQ